MSVRREEAYYTSAANEKRSFRTCGHNELCPYKGWFRYYENSSYTEFAWFLRQRYSFYGYKARLGGNLFGMRLIFNRVTPWPSMRCKRPSFTMRKTANGNAKDGLSSCERPPLAFICSGGFAIRRFLIADLQSAHDRCFQYVPMRFERIANPYNIFRRIANPPKRKLAKKLTSLNSITS